MSALRPPDTVAGDAVLPIAPAPSPAQKQFNTLLDRIAQQRRLLADWEAALQPYHRRYGAELVPLLRERHAALAELAHFLDAAYGWKGLSRSDRRALAECICTLALAAAQGADDGAATHSAAALYARYAEDGPATAPPPAAEPPAPAAAGEELSPEAQFERLDQALEAERLRAAAERDARRGARKKTAQQRKHEAEALQASQSVRDVYRKLASALHPDREQDPAERARKTVLMQRANEAYAANRLLDLLQLQLEAEQIDPARMAALGEERLKPYNRLLAGQLAELERENLSAAETVRRELGLDLQAKVTPATVAAQLRQALQWLQADLQALRQERRGLVDAEALRVWLKAHRRMARQE